MFYLYDRAEYVNAIAFRPVALVEGGSTWEGGETYPIFDIDILSVHGPDTTDGVTMKSFDRQAFSIGETACLSVDASLVPSQTLAVRISLARNSSIAQTLLEQEREYYWLIEARTEGVQPVAVSVLSVPLYQIEWRHDVFYDASFTFLYDKANEQR